MKNNYSEMNFDYVIIGGGSAGCVLANRLSENPKISVCLIEAGGKGNSSLVRIPIGLSLMVPSKINNWAFESEPQAAFNGRRSYLPRGKALGGTSAINAMIYIRGDRYDYDHWAQLGNEGWSYKDVLPYFLHSENNLNLTNQYHGNQGPLPVCDVQSDNSVPKKFLKGAQEAGYSINKDFNGQNQEGFGMYQVTQKEGERWSSARAYIEPIQSRKNLTVLTNTRVHKILIQDRTAVGVEIKRKGQSKTNSIHANKEVLLCAGAFQSPQILMLSGIGDSHLLNQFQIGVEHHLPGVGQNLHDHPNFFFLSRSNDLDTLGFSPKGIIKLLVDFWRYYREKRGFLASNGPEAGGFVKLGENSPAPDVQFHFMMAIVEDHFRKLHFRHGYSLNVCLLRPKSRGYVSLHDANPLSAPKINLNFYDNKDDLKQIVEGFKVAKKILVSQSMSTITKARLNYENINTDEEIIALIRAKGDNTYHPAGSCKMGKDEMSVVDSKLKVHGIKGLRVVDASIMPTPIGGNLNAPIIMIAEKAADMIRAESK